MLRHTISNNHAGLFSYRIPPQHRVAEIKAMSNVQVHSRNRPWPLSLDASSTSSNSETHSIPSLLFGFTQYAGAINVINFFTTADYAGEYTSNEVVGQESMVMCPTGQKEEKFATPQPPHNKYHDCKNPRRHLEHVSQRRCSFVRNF